MRRVFAVAVIALLPLMRVGPIAQQEGPLTDEEVQAAIDAGVAAPVRPVVLFQTVALYRTEGSPVVAVAYSAKMLIGMAARVAREEGRQLTVRAVPETWRQRVVCVAVRSNERPAFFGVKEVIDEEARMAITREREFARPETGIAPLWLSHDPRSVLRAFGVEVPYSNVAIVAAFPLSVLRPNYVVVAYRSYPAENFTAFWSGRMFADDVEALLK
jgi:hypothetical protein